MLKKINKLLSILSTLILVVLLVCIVSIISAVIYFRSIYRDKVIPNVYFYDINMTWKNGDEVYKTVLTKKMSLQNQVVLEYEDKTVTAKAADLGFDWDEGGTALDIINVGRQDSYINNLQVWASSLLFRRRIEMKSKFDWEIAKKYLMQLASSINQEAVDGKFDTANGKVVNFAMGKNGKKLLVDRGVDDIKKAILSGQGKVSLTIDVVKAQGADDIEKMGIKEVIATGSSNFAGSPPNRIHNITVGAQVFNGVLIAPGENFSFISTLGDVSAKTGYLPELVIKEDKTIPEYGGGLCQVSTTFFRAAINAGLPIVERSAHAYRVVYYEPAGFDSTIYQPKPDLVFTNDTGHQILVQTRVVGNEMFVDFYGTNDGRKVDVSKSTIYNYVQPGEPIMIETAELKPGEKKQTDTAHTGADAYFTRKITYADGKVKDDRFDSHYIAWRAKFLVGKAVDNPTSTPPYSMPNPK